MQMASRHFNILKKILITIVSWSLLLTPTANALAQSEAAQENTPPAQTQTQEEESASNNEQAEENPYSDSDPNYCYADGSDKQCSDSLVYNCHLKSCVDANDNNNYNREYLNCGGDKECQDELKADAEMFTSYKTADAKDGETEVLNYLSAASQIGFGCYLLAGSGCNMDGIGAMFTGAIIFAGVMMSALGDDYKDKFEQYKNELENLEENSEKGWNHRLQKVALETEVSMLGEMEKAAKEKIKHHKRTMALITVSGIIAALCAAATFFGCPASNPCTYWVITLAAVALSLELAAMNIAKDAKDDASKAKSKAEAVLEKLKSRYNNQYASIQSQGLNMGRNNNLQTVNQNLETNAQGTGLDEEQQKEIKNMPEVKVNMGSMGKNGKAVGNILGVNEIIDSYNQTRKTGNPEYVNNEANKKAAKISKVARRVFTELKKSKNINDKTKDAMDAFLNPNSKRSKKFMAKTLAENVSPIQMALNYRKAGGSDAAGQLKKNKELGKKKAVAYDTSSKNYLKNLKAKLKDFETMVNDDSGIMTMTNYSDPTVNKNAIEQLNQTNSDPKEAIHKDSGVSLWKIISNRYNEIKLKKGFN